MRQLPPINPMLLIKDPIQIKSRLTKHVESDRRELSLVEHVRDAFQPATRQPSAVQEPVPQISAVTSVRHYPASLAHFGEDADPKDPDPLFLVSMGDHIPLGGFRMASELVDWEFYNQQQGFWAGQICNESHFAPDRQALHERIEEEHVWSEDEGQEEDMIWGTGIPSQDALHDLWEARKSTLLNAQRRLYGNPADWLPDDTIMIKRMAQLKARQAMKGSKARRLTEELARPRRSDRPKFRKRHFDELD